jgi:threonyl-tRNA synthetase
MIVKFNDAVLEKNESLTVYEAANELGLMSRSVLAAKVNGAVCALSTPLTADAEVELLTFAEEEGAKVFRHSASHVLAQAVKRLYPATKLTIGPAVDGGLTSAHADHESMLGKVVIDWKKNRRKNGN